MTLPPRFACILFCRDFDLPEEIPLQAHVEHEPGRDEHRADDDPTGWANPERTPAGERGIEQRCQTDNEGESKRHREVLHVRAADDRVDRCTVPGFEGEPFAESVAEYFA